ncbi:MAG: exonuclease domain-containing protein [Myxococcota bacterium]
MPLAVLDFEMTGLDPHRDRVCEVAVVRGSLFDEPREFQSLVRPAVTVSKGARKVHGLTDQVLRRAPLFKRIAPELVEFLDGAVLICHNVPFDVGFLHRELDDVGVPFAPPVSLDTLLMARRLFAFRRNNLASVCESLGVEFEQQHRALGDAHATLKVFRAMMALIAPEGGVTVRDLLALIGQLAPDSPLRLAQKRILTKAFREKVTVRLAYQSTGNPTIGPVEREVGLWALALPYMQGWCYLREGERVFRLDRIRTVQPEGRPYDIPNFERRV